HPTDPTRIYTLSLHDALPILNMLVERFTMDVQPRWKNGHPPQRTTGVASSNSIQGSHAAGKTRCTGMLGTMSAIAIASRGTLSADRKSTRLNSSHVKISYAVF